MIFEFAIPIFLRSTSSTSYSKLHCDSFSRVTVTISSLYSPNQGEEDGKQKVGTHLITDLRRRICLPSP